MRKMQKGSQTLTILEWIMVSRLCWEYYVTEEWNEDNCAYCLVDGDFQEMGQVSLDEIKPYISARTRDLTSLAPAPGWKWLDKGESK